MFYSIIVKCLGIVIFLSSSMFAMESIRSPKIVVIGAGLAGLTTAYRLQEKGFDVEVFEARQRVGGRVLTVKVDGQISELGGQNINDGSEARNILSLIEELGLEVASYKRPFSLRFFNGNDIIDLQPLLDVYGFTPQTLKEQLISLGSSSNNMQEVLDKLFPNDEILQKAYYVRLAAYEGVIPKNLSTRYISTLYALLLGGGPHQNYENDVPLIHHIFLKEGNSLLPIALSEKLKRPVYLNHPLISVSREGTSYTLLFENGKEVRAEVVVLATPCSVYEDIAFEKNVISPKKLSDMLSILYGINSKILIPGTFTDKGSFTNGRVIAYKPHPSHSITLFYVDEHARFDQDTLSATFHFELPLIQRVSAQKLDLDAPQMAIDCPFVSYSGPVGYSWPNDPYAKGSYSVIAAGQEEELTQINEIKGEKVKALFEPIDNRFFFAGEHTSVLLDIGGTMEAAVESGERTARLIAKCLSTDKE